MERKKRYRSYLLRLWMDDFGDINADRGWQISLENPFTGERRGFASLRDLMKYLEMQIQEKDDQQIP